MSTLYEFAIRRFKEFYENEVTVDDRELGRIPTVFQVSEVLSILFDKPMEGIAIDIGTNKNRING